METNTLIATARTLLEEQLRPAADASCRVYDMIRSEAKVILRTGVGSSYEPALQLIAATVGLYKMPANNSHAAVQVNLLLKELAIQNVEASGPIRSHRWGDLSIVLESTFRCRDDYATVQAVLREERPGAETVPSPLTHLVNKLDTAIATAKGLELGTDQYGLVRDILSGAMESSAPPMVFSQRDFDQEVQPYATSSSRR